MAWRRGLPFIKRRRLWRRLYQTTSYLKSALWTVPIGSILLVIAITPAIRALDRSLGWNVSGLDVDGAEALYQTVITLTLSFVVFTFGSLLVAIQVASGQMTPRIIATALLRDNVVRYSVGLFVFSLVFAVVAHNRGQGKVNDLAALFTALLGIGSIAMFLFLIDHAARQLRPVSVLARIGDDGLQVIRSVYPYAAGEAPAISRNLDALPSGPRRTVSHTGASEIVLAVDLETLVREARRHNGTVELVPRVGDFVPTDEPLFVLYGGAQAIDDEALRAAVAFGPERTMEQDPLFSFRIVADIALKALSPAINDPTTGVLAIDQLHRLLHAVGKRQLRGEVISDAVGKERLILRTPNWEDFVHLACTEIRVSGAGNLQIARRLRAMLDHLVATLPPDRHPPVEEEREQLDRTLKSLYKLPEDLALARTADSQGLGPSSTSTQAAP